MNGHSTTFTIVSWLMKIAIKAVGILLLSFYCTTLLSLGVIMIPNLSPHRVILFRTFSDNVSLAGQNSYFFFIHPDLVAI